MSDDRIDLSSVKEAIEEIRWRQANPPFLVVHPDHPQLADLEEACATYGIKCEVTEAALDPPQVIFVDPSKLPRPGTFEIDYGDYQLPIARWPENDVRFDLPEHLHLPSFYVTRRWWEGS